MESARYESVEKTKFFLATIILILHLEANCTKHWGEIRHGVEKCIAILDVEGIFWIRHILGSIFHQEMKHSSLVGLFEEPVGCAEAVRDRGERVPHQLVKVKGLIQVLRLDEQHGSEVTLLTVLDNLQS